LFLTREESPTLSRKKGLGTLISVRFDELNKWYPLVVSKRQDKVERVRLATRPIFVSALWLLALVEGAAAQSPNDACDLPKDLQSIVEGKYPGTRIVTLSDLNEDDKQLFQKEHAGSCPGLAKVDFYGDGKPTFALALTRKSQATATTKLVLAHQVGANWEVAILDKSDGPVPVVWSDKPGEYKSVYQHKIRATRPVIVFCGYSSWAILYAWTGNRTAKLWLRD